MNCFWTRSEKLPPCLVRLLARHRHGPPLTDIEISQASGLPVHQVFVISHCTSWDGIDLPTMRRFLVGCDVDFEDHKAMYRIDAYLATKPAPTWLFLRRSPYWKSFYQPLMIRFKQSLLRKNSHEIKNSSNDRDNLGRSQNLTGSA